MIFNRLDHGLVLVGRVGDLHPSRPANRRVRDISIATNLIAGVDNNHALGLGQNAGHLTQHRRLAHPGAAQDQDAVSLSNDILDDVDRSIDGPAHAAGQTNNLMVAVANAGDAMQGACDAGPVVVIKITDTLDNLLDLLVSNLGIAQDALAIDIARSGQAAEIHDDLQQFVFAADFFHCHANTVGQG